MSRVSTGQNTTLRGVLYYHKVSRLKAVGNRYVSFCCDPGAFGPTPFLTLLYTIGIELRFLNCCDWTQGVPDFEFETPAPVSVVKLKHRLCRALSLSTESCALRRLDGGGNQPLEQQVRLSGPLLLVQCM